VGSPLTPKIRQHESCRHPARGLSDLPRRSGCVYLVDAAGSARSRCRRRARHFLRKRSRSRGGSRGATGIARSAIMLGKRAYHHHHCKRFCSASPVCFRRACARRYGGDRRWRPRFHARVVDWRGNQSVCRRHEGGLHGCRGDADISPCVCHPGGGSAIYMVEVPLSSPLLLPSRKSPVTQSVRMGSGKRPVAVWSRILVNDRSIDRRDRPACTGPKLNSFRKSSTAVE
jgi:hypothetical protein